MNKYDLFDAFGAIDDDLLERSDRKGVRKFPIRRAFIAAAAVMLLAVTAVATPAVREWFYSVTMTKTTQAQLSYQDGLEEHFWAEGRIDLTLPESTERPESILELRVPTYFASFPDEWVYTPMVVMPGESIGFFEGIWTNNSSGESLNFYQSAILLDGQDQFTISLGNDSAVEESTILIDDLEYKVYQVSASSFGDFAIYHPHTDIIWADAEYAYHIVAYGMDLNALEEVIRSIEPAGSIGEYTRDAVFEPVEDYFTLASLPGGLEIFSTEHNGFCTWQNWGDRITHSVTLTQHRHQSEGNDIGNIDLPLTLEDLQKAYPNALISVQELDDKNVSLVWTGSDSEFDPDVYAYWSQEGYEFTLVLTGPDYTPADAISCIESLVPMENFPE